MVFRILVLVVATLSWVTIGWAQTPTCQDSRANNFNNGPGTYAQNGLCTYNPTSVNPMGRFTLPTSLQESSGLLYDGNGYIWTMNDSGNLPILYKLDTATGQIVQQVTVINAQNIDWEDLTQDDDNIYVGDFGNNDGNRTDLRVLVIPKSTIGSGAAINVVAQFIRFSYPDQRSWAVRQIHNFDCEAFAVIGDSLHLFTKNWANKWTKHYTLPKTPGNYQAQLIDSMNVNCLVTGAAYMDPQFNKQALALIGYDKDNLTACIWMYWDINTVRFNQMNKRRLDLPSVLFVGQVEAICFHHPNRMLISNEKRSIISARVAAVNYGGAAGQLVSSPKPKAGLVKPFVKPGFNGPVLVIPAGNNLQGTLNVVDAKGSIWQTLPITAGQSEYAIDTVQLPLGTYYLVGTPPIENFRLRFQHPVLSPSR